MAIFSPLAFISMSRRVVTLRGSDAVYVDIGVGLVCCLDDWVNYEAKVMKKYEKFDYFCVIEIGMGQLLFINC